MPEDPTVLLVKPKDAADKNALSHPFYYYVGDGDNAARAVLLGYSFFGEVAGLSQGADGLPIAEGLDLLTDAEYASRKYKDRYVVTGGRYSMSFDDYLDYYLLTHPSTTRRINFCRLFLFQLGDSRVELFVKKSAPDGTLKYDLYELNEAYLSRLVEFITKARKRGIVVNLSLFSSHMLRKEVWPSSPFNANNNLNEVIKVGKGETEALKYFCVIKKPASAVPATPEEKLYDIQRNFVKTIVDRTRPYWNVVYEIFNEPSTGTEAHAVTNIKEWHVIVADWLNEFLADEHQKRKRLIGVNVSPLLKEELLNALGVRRDNVAGKVDFLSLHGSQWGGNPAATITGACKNFAAAPPDTEILDGINQFPGINDAINEYKDRWLGLIFDSDAHYLAQKFPTPYVKDSLSVYGNFNYRWGFTLLHEVVEKNCDIVFTDGKKTLGLGQRQGLIYTAPNIANVAPLPTVTMVKPANLKVAVETVNNQPQLHLTFDIAGDDFDGYVVYFGPTADTLGRGTDIFPPMLYFGKGAGDLKVPFPVRDNGQSVYVAVAARKARVPGEPSNTVFVPFHNAEIDLSMTSLRVGRDVHIPTRRSFRDGEEGVANRVAFKNTGLSQWVGHPTFVDGNGQSVKTTLGVNMPVRGMVSGLSLLFIPMVKENTGGQEATVLPGQSVVINLKVMQLTLGFMHSGDEPVPLLLPYSRQPLSFNMGMGTITPLSPGGVSYSHFGTVYEGILPDANRTPIEVIVDNPQRLASEPQTKDLDLDQDGYLTLEGENHYTQFLTSVTASTPSPNTIIRSSIRLQNTGSADGPPLPVLYVRREDGGLGGGAEAASVEVNLSAVMLDPTDLYYAGPHVDPKNRTYDVPGRGGTIASTLAPFETKYTSTAAWSDTPVKPAETITWEVRPGWANIQSKQLIITNNADIESARVAVFTVDVWENIPTKQDQRQKSDELEFTTNGPSIGYVDLGDAAQHRYYLASLNAKSPAIISYGVALKADANGDFRRMLEVRADNYQPPLRVAYKVLEVHVGARAGQGPPPPPVEIDPLLAARILEFFNRATDAQEIVSKIKDDPSVGRDSPRVYGVRHKLSERIIQVRDSLPDKRFTSVYQIDRILGVGSDTFADILFTFQKEDGTKGRA